MSTTISFKDLEHARQTLEDFTLSYFPLHGLKLPEDFLRHWDLFAYVEAVLYQVDKQNESSLLPPFDEPAALDLKDLRSFLQSRSLLSEDMEALLAQGEEYWCLERKICRSLATDREGSITLEEVHQCSAFKSFDYRVLHELLHEVYSKSKSSVLMEYLTVDEHLLDVADDLVDYEVEDVFDNAFNFYRCYVRLFGKDAQLSLAEYISKLEEKRAALLSQLDENLQRLIQSRQIEAATKPGSEKWIFPEPIFDEQEYRCRVAKEADT